MADHLYIHLIVYGPGAADELIAAARELRKRALRTRDLRKARFGVAAEKCMLALAEAYTQMQTASLERPAEFVQLLPELCADLWACVETERAPTATAWCETWAPALSALSAEGLLSAADDEECAVRFSLVPDAAREFVVCTEAAPQARNGAFTDYLRDAALSLEQWAGGARRAVARLVPTTP